MDYKLLSFGPDEQSARAGILIEDFVYDLADLLETENSEVAFDPARLISVFQNWGVAKSTIEKSAEHPAATASNQPPSPAASPTMLSPPAE